MEKVFLTVYLVVLGIFDGKTCQVPVALVGIGFPAVAAAVLYQCCCNPAEWELAVLAAVLGAVPGSIMLAVARATRKVGYGDGLVLMVVGMFIGYGSCMLLICFSLLLMSLWCIVILCVKKGNCFTAVPYLPFLAMVYLVGLFV